MLPLRFRKYLLAGLAGLMVIITALIVKTGIAHTSIIPADTAVNLALSYSKDYGMGGLVNQPSELFGKVTTYGEAVQYIFAQPISPNDEIAKMGDTPVWLIILQGKIVEHVPATPGIPAKDVIHSQMAVIINGNSGVIIEEVLISPQKTLSITSLPALTPPPGTVPTVSTKIPIQTEAPLPTATLVP